MRVVGIIAEFDPFHNGHEYIIRKAKELTGDPRAKALIVMSGPFVQRGNFSVLPKHVRAHQALCNGADLVLELPFTFACAPSERFARGAVQALYKTGIVTDIAFGIDTEDPSLIEELAFTEPSDARIKEHLAEGYSYPSALLPMPGRSLIPITRKKNLRRFFQPCVCLIQFSEPII